MAKTTTNRHKWFPKVTRFTKESSSTACTKCGMIRQHVGGVPTYFIDDTVYDKIAPKCKPIANGLNSHVAEAYTRTANGPIYSHPAISQGISPSRSKLQTNNV